MAILHEYQPAALRLYSPRAIVGDGNCCYRAVSLAMYGDQSHHLHVRLLAAAEMIMHPEHYDVSAANYVGEIDANTVFTGPYAELVDAVTSDGGYAELMHIVAISAALGMCIVALLPKPGIVVTLLTTPLVPLHSACA